ncbi:MAG: hypothetical protein IJL92_04705 [Thermoguttaceae bacterium]|nr:hypothetical protein [Thermoguttaceae bacterium]
MFENRREPAFGATKVGNSRTASFRYQLVGWCELIAREVVKARALNNHSDMIDKYLLDALEASSELSCLDAASLTKMLLCGDYVLQLAQAMTEETSPDVIAELETQVADAVAGIQPPDDALVADMEAQGGGYLPESRLAALGEERFAIVETIGSALVGAAENLSRALKLSVSACQELEFEAIGLRNHLESLKPKERRERRAELTEEANELEERAAQWRAKNREALDAVVDALDAISRPETTEEALYDVLVNVGKLNATALELLEKGVTSKYGEPTPVGALTSPKPGKCVLYSGEDLDVLAALLDQAEFNEVDVWTRGEAIAAHGYKCLRDKPRLAGHYGGSWRNQQHELGAFPGGIIVDKTPVDEPDDSYAPYMFSTTPTIWESVRTLPKKNDGTYNMTPAVRAAKDSSGFFRSPNVSKLPVGFGGPALMETVEHASRAFRAGRLSKVVVVGGQDAAGDACDYFTRLFAAVGDDSFVLAFGDVKFRFDPALVTPTQFGVTRLVDVGRERDANASLRFVDAFAKELDRDAATVPVEFFVSLWGETSVAYLLTLIALGYRKIVVGPNPPACWTPAFIDVLRERYGVRLASDPETDLS